MAVSKEKLLARLNIDTSPVTAKLQDLNKQFNTFGKSLKQTVSTITSGDSIKRITTTFKEMSSQISQIEKQVEVFNSETKQFEPLSQTVTTSDQQNQKKYFLMLKQWWKELSVEQRNNISLLQDYSARLGNLASQTSNSTTKGQILGVKNTIDSKLDTTIASSQKAIYGEITRLLKEQYSIKRQMDVADVNELAVLQQKEAIVKENLFSNQALLENNRQILTNESYENQLAQTKLNIEQQEAAYLDKKQLYLEKNTQELNEQLSLNKQNYIDLQRQTELLKAQALQEDLYPKKEPIYTNTLLGKFYNSAIYFSSGMLQSAIFQAFSTSLQSIKEYENGIVDLRRTLQNITENELTEMGTTAISYAKEFGLSITTVQDTMTELARAGVDDLQELRDLTKTVAIGMNTTEIETSKEMVSSLVSTIKQLKLEWTDSMEIIDSWNYLADKYAVHTNDFAEAIQRAGSASKNLGLDLYEVNAIVTLLGEATQASGSQLGTALKALEVRLLRPDTVTTLESYGIAVKKNAEEYLSFQDIITNVSNKLDRLSESSVAYQDIIQAMGGSFRANWAATLTANWDEYERLVAEQRDNQGYSIAENEKTMDTLTKKIEQAKAAYTEMFIVTADQSGITQFLKNSADSLAAFSTSLKESGVSTFLLDMAEMIVVFKLAMGACKLLNKAIGVDLVQGIKGFAQIKISKIFPNAQFNLMEKQVEKISQRLAEYKVLNKETGEYETASLSERLVLLKKIDKQLGTNVSQQLEYQDVQLKMNEANKPLKTHIGLLDKQIEKQLSQYKNVSDAKSLTQEIVNLDSEAIDIKLKDIGMTEQQTIAIKENVVERQKINLTVKQNEAAVNDAKAKVEGYNSIIKTNTRGLIAAKAATLGLKVATMALQTALSFGIGFAISGIISLISSLANRTNDLREAAVEASKVFDEESESLNDIKERINEYNSILMDSTTSLEDVASARKDLLKLQKEIIDKYGEESLAVDFLNKSLEEQKRLIFEIEVTKAKQYLMENKEAIDDAKKYVTRIQKQYMFGSSIPLKGNDYLGDLVDSTYGVMNIYGYERGEYIYGTVSERLNTLQSLYQKIEETSAEAISKGLITKDLVEDALSTISSRINEIKSDERYKDNMSIFNEAGRAEFIKEYSLMYAEILSAQSEFDKAFEEGDTKRINEAVKSLKEYKQKALDTVSDDAMLENYVQNVLFSSYDATLQSVENAENTLTELFSKTVYDNVLSKYEYSTTTRFSTLLKQCGATSENIRKIISSLGLNINNLSDDILLVMSSIIGSSEEIDTNIEIVSDVVNKTNSYWNSLDESVRQSGITFEDVLYHALKGTYNFSEETQALTDRYTVLKSVMADTLDTANNWIEKANALSEIEPFSKEYYNAVREIAEEYPNLVKGIDQTTGAYILQENYLEYIIEKQRDSVDNQNKLIENNLLYAIASAEAYATLKKGTEEETNALNQLAEAREAYANWVKSKDTLYDSTMAEILQKEAERISELIETATKRISAFDDTLSLLGNIDTRLEKQIQANLLASKYLEITKQISVFELEWVRANENEIEIIREQLLELKQQKIEIEDTTKALIEQVFSQEKANKLTRLEIEQKKELLALERELYGEEGQKAYEERISRQLEALSNADNANIVTQLADAYLGENEERIKALKELLEVQEGITNESTKQVELEQLKLELENAKLQKTTQLLKKDEQGNWQYEYVYDYQEIENLQNQVKQAERDYVSERINNERDSLANKYDEKAEIIETSYEDMKTRVELFYNDMDALVNEKFSEISTNISEALKTLTNSATFAEEISVILNQKLLESQLSTYTGVASSKYTLSTKTPKILDGVEAIQLSPTTATNSLATNPNVQIAVPDMTALFAQLNTLLSKIDTNNTGSTAINIGKLEFPNITSPDGLEEALLNLPIVAVQYNER